jgi:hypothetical protein
MAILTTAMSNQHSLIRESLALGHDWFVVFQGVMEVGGGLTPQQKVQPVVVKQRFTEPIDEAEIQEAIEALGSDIGYLPELNETLVPGYEYRYYFAIPKNDS